MFALCSCQPGRARRFMQCAYEVLSRNSPCLWWLTAPTLGLPGRVLTDRAFLAEPKTMLWAFMLGGAVAGAFIILFGLLGVFGAAQAITNPSRRAPAKLPRICSSHPGQRCKSHTSPCCKQACWLPGKGRKRSRLGAFVQTATPSLSRVVWRESTQHVQQIPTAGGVWLLRSVPVSLLWRLVVDCNHKCFDTVLCAEGYRNCCAVCRRQSAREPAVRVAKGAGRVRH